MSTPQTYRLLSELLVRLMRPLVRLMLRNGITYHAFAELAKGVFIEIADQEFRIPARKQSDSRTSMITGLTRRDVKRYGHSAPLQHAEVFVRKNRAAQVISGWIQDKDFQDDNGEPLDLPFDDKALDGADSKATTHTFAELVHRHSTDTSVRAILDEMIRVGAAARLSNNKITLLTRAYIPYLDDASQVAVLGATVGNLLETIEHNLWSGANSPLFQRMISNRAIPVEKTAEFHLLSQRKSQQLLETLDSWLSEHAVGDEEAVAMDTRQVGLGVYYFQNKL